MNYCNLFSVNNDFRCENPIWYVMTTPSEEETMKPRKIIAVFFFTAAVLGLPQGILADDDKHRNGHQERYRNRHQSRNNLAPVNNSTYKEHCGACHFAYQPGLLPSASWKQILDRTDDHFGESFEMDAEDKKALLDYLATNAAERSTAKGAERIMKGLDGKIPMRITEIPYIKNKHRKIGLSVLNQESVGSLSNCTACHRRGEEGIFDHDYVVIPK